MSEKRVQTLWQQEATDLLIEHYKTGVTASASAKIINAKFGTQYTRNAIIGKRDRVGLGRANPIQSHMMRDPLAKAALDAARRRKRAERLAKLELAEQSRQRKQEIQRLREAEAHAAKIEAVAPVKSFAKSTVDAIMSLNFRSCRYPIGGVGADDFHFCCEPQDEGSSYCKTHRAICTVKVPLKMKVAA
ncbi:MAG: GcrA family cell cycle regulator [Pseudomonadota bacterium]